MNLKDLPGTIEGVDIKLVKLPIDIPGSENVLFEEELAIHSVHANAIMINYPGYRGSREGFADKYQKIAGLVVESGIAAVVRISNGVDERVNYTQLLQERLRQTLKYVLTHAEEICGNPHPEIWLAGFSAGGSAVGAIAHEFPQVSRILLVAPSSDAGNLEIDKGMQAFLGDVFILVGDQDEIVGSEVGAWYQGLAIAAKSCQLVVLPNCDHQFRATPNGKILSQAPFWAFDHLQGFPDFDSGIELY